VQKERALLKRLEALVAEGKLDGKSGLGLMFGHGAEYTVDPAGNEALRAHFQQLTEKMLVPLNRYFQTLVPTLSPAPSPNPGIVTDNSTIKPFSLPAFLTHLRTHGPNPLLFRTKGLSTKARVENDFYAAFGMSASFAGWLGARVESLGLAVAAQTSTLPVPSNVIPQRPRPVLGLGYGQSVKPAQISPEPTSESDTTRMSSDSSVGAWRASEESSRDMDTPLAETYSGRRASEGAVYLPVRTERK